MKIAIPVSDENLNFFGNAGHTPKFAVYELVGTGMFKSFKLEEIKNNPRTDLDHEHPEEEHVCNHNADDAEHIAQHDKMGAVLEGCDYVVVRKACKNTANAFTSHGLKLVKYNGEAGKAEAVLRASAGAFI